MTTETTRAQADADALAWGLGPLNPERFRSEEPGYLKGVVTILGCMFHVEAVLVEENDEGIQYAVEEDFASEPPDLISEANIDRYFELCDLVGAIGTGLQTVLLNGRSYVVSIFPFCR